MKFYLLLATLIKLYALNNHWIYHLKIMFEKSEFHYKLWSKNIEINYTVYIGKFASLILRNCHLDTLYKKQILPVSMHCTISIK